MINHPINIDFNQNMIKPTKKICFNQIKTKYVSNTLIKLKNGDNILWNCMDKTKIGNYLLDNKYGYGYGVAFKYLVLKLQGEQFCIQHNQHEQNNVDVKKNILEKIKNMIMDDDIIFILNIGGMDIECQNLMYYLNFIDEKNMTDRFIIIPLPLFYQIGLIPVTLLTYHNMSFYVEGLEKINSIVKSCYLYNEIRNFDIKYNNTDIWFDLKMFMVNTNFMYRNYHKSLSIHDLQNTKLQHHDIQYNYNGPIHKYQFEFDYVSHFTNAYRGILIFINDFKKINKIDILFIKAKQTNELLGVDKYNLYDEHNPNNKSTIKITDQIIYFPFDEIDFKSINFENPLQRAKLLCDSKVVILEILSESSNLIVQIYNKRQDILAFGSGMAGLQYYC